MAPTTQEDFVTIPKQEYRLLKEVFRTMQRQAFLVRIDEAEKNLASGKTKAVSADDLLVIEPVQRLELPEGVDAEFALQVNEFIEQYRPALEKLAE